MEKFDVVIVGASFAGLAVASRLKGNVLLLDKKDIGDNVTSACGSITRFIESIGCEKSILQCFDTATLNIKNKVYKIPLARQFCTIDYSIFCNEFFKQSNVEFRKENVKGIENGLVKTSKSQYKARIYVDCSGWPAVLASSVEKGFVDKQALSAGVETEAPYRDDKLRFFLDEKLVENGAAWLFPAGKNSRFGVGSYGKNSKLMQSLKNFVNSYGLNLNGTHGNYIPHCFRKPIIENIFVVGDAVGNVLPLTAEGIRPSIRAGIYCGDIIQQILQNKLSFEEGLKRYANFCLKNRRYYNILLKAQRRMVKPSNFTVNLIFKLLSYKPIANIGLRLYENF